MLLSTQFILICRIVCRIVNLTLCIAKHTSPRKVHRNIVSYFFFFYRQLLHRIGNNSYRFRSLFCQVKRPRNSNLLIKFDFILCSVSMLLRISHSLMFSLQGERKAWIFKRERGYL